MKNRLRLASLITIAAMPVFGNAATYNFVFNNTEQGAGSTANPTVNASGGSAPTGTTQLAPGMTSPDAAAAASPTTGARGVSEAHLPAAATEPMDERSRFRVGLGGMYGTGRTGRISNNQPREYDGDEIYLDAKMGALLSVAYFPIERLGINAFAAQWLGGKSIGRHGFALGLEGEFSLIRLGTQHDQPAFTASLLAGANYNFGPVKTTLATQVQVQETLYTTVYGGAQILPHAGMRLGFEFGDHYGFAATGRAVLAEEVGVVADAGLQFYF